MLADCVAETPPARTRFLMPYPTTPSRSPIEMARRGRRASKLGGRGRFDQRRHHQLCDGASPRDPVRALEARINAFEPTLLLLLIMMMLLMMLILVLLVLHLLVLLPVVCQRCW